MTKEKFAMVKNVLKVEAKELSALKIEIKETMRSGKYAGKLQWQLSLKKSEWRHKHIAYCLLRGRTIDEIESYCHDDNKPNIQLVEKYKGEFERDA